MEKQMTGMNRLLPRFPLGLIVATPGALRALEQANQSPFEFVERHQAGDWGELCEEDKRENEFSVQNPQRLSDSKRSEDLDHYRSGQICYSLASARVLAQRQLRKSSQERANKKVK